MDEVGGVDGYGNDGVGCEDDVVAGVAEVEPVVGDGAVGDYGYGGVVHAVCSFAHYEDAFLACGEDGVVVVVAVVVGAGSEDGG